jgi:SAM-dependent methyltransferase
VSDDSGHERTVVATGPGRIGAMSEPAPPNAAALGTAGPDYAQRLDELQNKRWKKLLNVQAPYRANLRRMRLGRTLDVGCGNGRNLSYLPDGSVGVDHNVQLVAAAQDRGCEAYTVEQFFADPQLCAPGAFDALLAAHLVEHLNPVEARQVLRPYLPSVRAGGRVVFITPQERGFDSDPTHVSFTDFNSLEVLCADLGLTPQRRYSFPFPRWTGRIFVYNEFNVIADVPPAGGPG